MWYAVTANPSNRKNKEKKKEFFSREHEVIVSGETKSDLEQKLMDTKAEYPQEFRKYMKAGIKIIEAENTIQAKHKAKNINIFFDERGQYNLL